MGGKEEVDTESNSVINRCLLKALYEIFFSHFTGSALTAKGFG